MPRTNQHQRGRIPWTLINTDIAPPQSDPQHPHRYEPYVHGIIAAYVPECLKRLFNHLPLNHSATNCTTIEPSARTNICAEWRGVEPRYQQFAPSQTDNFALRVLQPRENIHTNLNGYPFSNPEYPGANSQICARLQDVLVYRPARFLYVVLLQRLKELALRNRILN